MMWPRLCVALMLAVAVGCGSQPRERREISQLKTPVDVLKEEVANHEEIAMLLETIKDNASAAAALPELDKLAERSGKLLEKFEDFPDFLAPDDEKQEEFRKQNAALLKKEDEVSQRLRKAYAAALKAAPQSGDQIKKAMRKTGLGSGG